MNPVLSRASLTSAGRRRVQAQRDQLTERLEELTTRLKDELQHKKDLNWYGTQQEIDQLQGRIRDLQAALAEDAEPGTSRDDTVDVGSRVTVEDENGREHSFLIVAPIETDTDVGSISYESPVGAALIGRRPGERVSVAVPRGERQFTVLRIRSTPAAGGD